MEFLLGFSESECLFRVLLITLGLVGAQCVAKAEKGQRTRNRVKTIQRQMASPSEIQFGIQSLWNVPTQRAAFSSVRDRLDTQGIRI